MEMILPEMVQKEIWMHLLAQLAESGIIAGVALADVPKRSSTTVQSVQTGVGSNKQIVALLNPAPCHQ